MDPVFSDKFSHFLILCEGKKKKKGIVIIVDWEHSMSRFFHLLLVVILSVTFKYSYYLVEKRIYGFILINFSTMHP